MERATKILVIATLSSITIFFITATIALVNATNPKDINEDEKLNSKPITQKSTSFSTDTSTPIQDTQSQDPEYPAGQLPSFISPGNKHHILIIDPDDFDLLIRVQKENTLRAKEIYGTDRILISNWMTSIQDPQNPKLIWTEGTCDLEQSTENLHAATKVTSVISRYEILVSGHINWNSNSGTFNMKRCRLHGYYEGTGGGYQPLSDQTRRES